MPPFRRTKRDHVEHTYAFKLQVLKWIKAGRNFRLSGKSSTSPRWLCVRGRRRSSISRKMPLFQPCRLLMAGGKDHGAASLQSSSMPCWSGSATCGRRPLRSRSTTRWWWCMPTCKYLVLSMSIVQNEHFALEMLTMRDMPRNRACARVVVYSCIAQNVHIEHIKH